MPLFDQIDNDMKEALRAGQKERLSILRGLKSDLKYKVIELGHPLTDDECIVVLSSSAKKHRESIEQFKAGNRDDLVQKEEFELTVITSYLPEQITEEKLRVIISETIAETGADSPQKMGLVMKALMPKLKGQADGKLVSRIVSELLAK
jgi:uncharacterized protein